MAILLKCWPLMFPNHACIKMTASTTTDCQNYSSFKLIKISDLKVFLLKIEIKVLCIL